MTIILRAAETSSEWDQLFRQYGFENPAAAPMLQPADRKFAQCLLQNVIQTQNELGARLAYVECRKINPREPAQAGVCPSDEGLRAILADIVLFSFGQTAKVCADRFPQLAEKSVRVVRRFELVYAGQIARVDQESGAAFRRLYPQIARVKRDENTQLANREGLERAMKLSKQQCENALDGIEGMSVANDFSLVIERLVDTHFQNERRRIFRC